MPDNPTWSLVIDLSLKAAQVVVTGWLGYQAMRIGNRQAETSSRKLKLDLYDKRYRIFRNHMAMVDGVNLKRIKSTKQMTKYIDRLLEANFLFKDDVYKWIRHCAFLCLEIVELESPNKDLSPEGVEANFKAASELRLQLDIVDRKSHQMFAPYIDFEHVF